MVRLKDFLMYNTHLRAVKFQFPNGSIKSFREKVSGQENVYVSIP